MILDGNPWESLGKSYFGEGLSSVMKLHISCILMCDRKHNSASVPPHHSMLYITILTQVISLSMSTREEGYDAPQNDNDK